MAALRTHFYSPQIPTKLVLKSTTKMSLHERFTAIRKRSEASVTNMKVQMTQQRQRRAQNARLLQHMENRSNLAEAFHAVRKPKPIKQQVLFNQDSLDDTPVSVGSVHQRLNVQARLGPLSGRYRGTLRTRGRGVLRGGGAGYPFSPPGGGASGFRGSRGRRGGSYQFSNARVGNERFTGSNRGMGFNRGRGAWRGRNRRSARGRRPAGRARGEVPTKDKLDQDLDNYMMMKDSSDINGNGNAVLHQDDIVMV